MRTRNKIIFTEQLLIVEPVGLDKLWCLTKRIEIPLKHISGATFDTGMKYEPKGLRWPGLRIFSKLSGVFYCKQEKVFYNLSGFENTVVIQLDGTQKYDRLVISVANPNKIVNEINAKI